VRLDWLADELRAAGLTVIEHDGWETRTMRPFDQFMPVGLLNHHTAGSSVLTNYPDPPYWSNRRLEASCNITIRGDGTVAVLNAGWAHDSGNGDKKVLAAVRADRAAPKPSDTYVDGKPGGVNPGVSGNRYYIDIEVQHLGNGDPIVPAQRMALIATNAVICRHMAWDPRFRLIGHREWTRRKVDPRWDGSANPMPQIRQDTLNTMEDEMTVSSWAQASWDWAKARFSWSSGPKEVVTVEQLMVFLKRYDDSRQSPAATLTEDDVKTIINQSSIRAPR
jgi:hypothetical protein